MPHRPGRRPPPRPRWRPMAENRLALPLQQRRRRVGIGGGDHQRHADAAVEHPQHLAGRDAAGARPASANTGGTGHARASSTALRAVGQHARQVAGQAAAGDVRRRLQQPGAVQRQQRTDVDPRRRHQRLAEALPRSPNGAGVGPAEAARRHHPAHQGEAVGMHAGGAPAPAPRRPARRRAAAARRARRRRRRSRRGRSRPPAYMPGISAVSPPTRAQPASRQPSAMPAITARACATSSLPVAK